MPSSKYTRPTHSLPPPIPPLLQPQPPLAPLVPPVHVVDLMTDAGSAVFGAVWRAKEAKLVECPALSDARPEFSAAVRALESGEGDPNAHLEVIVSAARPRDVYTLLMLAARNQSGSERLLAVAADLWPPPSGVTVNGIVRGDRDGLWRWRETLPLPPPKSWLRNWRDALPEWLR